MSEQTMDQLICAVFEQFGKTMYYIQMLEKSIKSIIFITKLIENTWESTDQEIEHIVDEITIKYSKCTLGQLTSEFKKIYNPPPTICTVLDRWNRDRIFIAHYYLSDNSQLLKDEEQCKYMLDELKLFTSDFEFAWQYIYALEERLYTRILTPYSLRESVDTFLKSSIQ